MVVINYGIFIKTFIDASPAGRFEGLFTVIWREKSRVFVRTIKIDLRAIFLVKSQSYSL